MWFMVTPLKPTAGLNGPPAEFFIRPVAWLEAVLFYANATLSVVPHLPKVGRYGAPSYPSRCENGS
jgi:hypothetical protein